MYLVEPDTSTDRFGVWYMVDLASRESRKTLGAWPTVLFGIHGMVSIHSFLPREIGLYEMPNFCKSFSIAFPIGGSFNQCLWLSYSNFPEVVYKILLVGIISRSLGCCSSPPYVGTRRKVANNVPVVTRYPEDRSRILVIIF